jgi:hypothetical protein
VERRAEGTRRERKAPRRVERSLASDEGDQTTVAIELVDVAGRESFPLTGARATRRRIGTGATPWGPRPELSRG